MKIILSLVFLLTLGVAASAQGYLKEAGIQYIYLENAQAGHSWTTWRADLQTLVPTLFK